MIDKKKKNKIYKDFFRNKQKRKREDKKKKNERSYWKINGMNKNWLKIDRTYQCRKNLKENKRKLKLKKYRSKTNN